MRIFAKWLICFFALLGAQACFPGEVSFFGGMPAVAGAATVLWLVNLALRPVLQVLALPVTILTLGLFSLVINAAMVRLTDFLLPVIRIDGFLAAFLIALFISVANGALLPKRR